MQYWSALLCYSLVQLAGLEGQGIPPDNKHDPVFLAEEGWKEPLYDPSCLIAQPPEDPQIRYEVIQGTLEEHCGLSHVRKSYSGSLITLSSMARFQELFSPGEEVTVVTTRKEDAILSQLLIRPSLYRLSQHFPSMEIRCKAIEEYLDLSWFDQHLLHRFLEDFCFTMAMFLATCCLCSWIYENDEKLPSKKTAGKICAYFSHYHLPFADCDPVSPDELLELLELTRIPCSPAKSTWYTFLSFCALFSGCSIWQEDPAEHLLRSDLKYSLYLHNSFQRIFTRSMTAALVNKLLDLAQDPSYETAARNVLEILLRGSTTLQAEDARRITDLLFYRTGGLARSGHVNAILQGPHAAVFMQQIRSRCEEGSKDYLWAAAALEREKDLTTISSEASLIALAKLALTGCCHTGNAVLSCSILTLEKGHPLLDSLIRWLTEDEDFDFVFQATEQMWLSSILDNHLLAKETIKDAAAERFLQQKDYRLLSVLPLTERLNPEYSDSQFRTDLERCFQYARNLSDPVTAIRLFRACVVGGCWDYAEITQNYRFLVQSLRCQNDQLSGIPGCMFRQVKTEIHRLFRSRLPQRADTMIPAALPEQLLFSKKFLSGNQFYRIATPNEALMLLDYQKNKLTEAESRLFLSRCIWEIPEAGPMVTVRWFYRLCCLGLFRQALEFRRNHAEILDRPWCYSESNLHPNLDPAGFAEYSNFLATRSRAQLGLEILELLYSSEPEYLPTWKDPLYRELVTAIWQSSPDYRVYIHQTLDLLLEPRSPEGIWNLYYDDLSVTSHVLEKCPKLHRRVLAFGYGDMEEMAMTALNTCGDSLLYLSPRLKKDDAICTAALKKTIRILNLISAPMIRDQEKIRQLLLGRPFPLRMAPPWLCEDKEFLKEHLKKRPQDLTFVDPALRQDPELLRICLGEASPET